MCACCYIALCTRSRQSDEEWQSVNLFHSAALALTADDANLSMTPSQPKSSHSMRMRERLSLTVVCKNYGCQQLQFFSEDNGNYSVSSV